MASKRPLGRPKGTTEEARRRALDQRKPRPAGSIVPGAGVVSVRLPIAYLKILDTEARHLGIKRGQFLTMLLRRKRGEIQLERAPDATKYSFTEKDLTERKLWIWYLSPEFRALVDDDLLRMGLGSIGSWVTQILNNWLGRPGGLTEELRKPS
jgi:hypothetical protein